MSFSVRDLIQGRPPPACVRPADPVLAALNTMIEHDYSQLGVVDEAGRPVGLVTSDSILRAASHFGAKLETLAVGDAMVKPVTRHDEDDLFETLDALRDTPAVQIERQGDRIVVEIEDFLSPTIVERLAMDLPLFRAQIADWRAMVDGVLIDVDYDGEVFDIALSDVSERKNDLVEGRYELPAPEGETTVAVKIVDMLGEEVLVTERVRSRVVRV